MPEPPLPFPPFAALKNEYRGRPAVILGNSPSLRDMRLELLDDFLTIGVNRILKLYIPHYLLFCDHPIAIQEQDDIRNYAGGKLIWYPLLRQHQWLENLPGCYGWSLAAGHSPTPANINIVETMAEKGLVQAEGTTPAYCIQMAYYWGCNPIAVAGVDMNAVPKNKEKVETHFYGEGLKISSTGGGNWGGKHETWFKQTREQLNKRGVETINLSPDDSAPFHSAGWARMSIEDFHTKYANKE